MSSGTGSLCWTFLIVNVIMFVSAEQKIITAEPGKDVTLTCRAPNNNISGLQWRKPDLQYGYVFFYRDGQFFPYYQHPYFMNRVDLQDGQMKDGDVSVILKNVTTADSGMYECLVNMRGTWLWQLISIIYLRVVPPDWKSITAEPGQDATLPCRAPDDNIRAVEWSGVNLGLLYRTYQWSYVHNRAELQDRPMKDGDVSVILKNVTTADSGMFKCKVTMTETYSEELRYIFLWVDPPEQKTITADPGQDVILTCRAPNMKNRAVMWSRADLEPECIFFYWLDAFLPGYQHPSFMNRVELKDRQVKDGDVSVILKDVTTDDEGTYRCIIMNTTNLLDPIKISSIIYLRVAPPGPALRFVALIVLPLLLLAGGLGFLIYRKQIGGSQERLIEIDEPPQQSFEMDADSCRSQTSEI